MKQMMLYLLLTFTPITSYSMGTTREDHRDFEKLLQQRDPQSDDQAKRLRHKQGRETEEPKDEHPKDRCCSRVLLYLLSLITDSRPHNHTGTYFLVTK